MGISEKVFDVNLTADLLNAVSTFHSPEIAVSVANRYGALNNMSCWEQEEMIDDLISKLNDAD